MRWILLTTVLPLLIQSSAIAQARPLIGHHADARVTSPTRLDWVFALANQSLPTPPAEWLEDYDSADQRFELYVPEKYDARRSYPAVVFISPGNGSSGFSQWQQACRREGIIFAGPKLAGNNCPTPRRVHIVMDVVDELRRNYNIDPDRTYLAGFSGGGRIACSIAFALPEYFGGVIPVCAGGELRQESWLRQRVVDRLSVAHITGTSDFNRGEVERFRQPWLSDYGVRSRSWTVRGMGHAIPDSGEFLKAYRWLEQGLEDRQELAKEHPASRIANTPSRAEWAAALMTEAKRRIEQPASMYSGLMQLKGIRIRWSDLPESEESLELLTDFDQRAKRPWDAEDIADQRRYLVAQARALDGYATGDLDRRYEPQRESMLKAALQIWTIIQEDGQDAEATAQADKRIPVIQSRLEKLK